MRSPSSLSLLVTSLTLCCFASIAHGAPHLCTTWCDNCFNHHSLALASVDLVYFSRLEPEGTLLIGIRKQDASSSKVCFCAPYPLWLPFWRVVARSIPCTIQNFLLLSLESHICLPLAILGLIFTCFRFRICVHPFSKLCSIRPRSFKSFLGSTVSRMNLLGWH